MYPNEMGASAPFHLTRIEEDKMLIRCKTRGTVVGKSGPGGITGTKAGPKGGKGK